MKVIKGLNFPNMITLNHIFKMVSKYKYKKSPTLGIFYVKYILAGKNGKCEINIIIARSRLLSRNSLRNRDASKFPVTNIIGARCTSEESDAISRSLYKCSRCTLAHSSGSTARTGTSRESTS